MTLKRVIGFSLRCALVTVALLLPMAAAYAHVTVQPKQSAPGTDVRYTMKVPTEKFVPTIRVEIEFPSALNVTGIEAKPQWKVEEKKDSSGKLVGMTLSGSIPTGESSEFNFMARNPSAESKLIWKVIQIYQDGSKSEWTGPEGSRTPSPVTEVRK
jgi:uncharacterized protein YcnI